MVSLLPGSSVCSISAPLPSMRSPGARRMPVRLLNVHPWSLSRQSQAGEEPRHQREDWLHDVMTACSPTASRDGLARVERHGKDARPAGADDVVADVVTGKPHPARLHPQPAQRDLEDDRIRLPHPVVRAGNHESKKPADTLAFQAPLQRGGGEGRVAHDPHGHPGGLDLPQELADAVDEAHLEGRAPEEPARSPRRLMPGRRPKASAMMRRETPA